MTSLAHSLPRRRLLAFPIAAAGLAGCSLFTSTSVPAAVQQAASIASALANGVSKIAIALAAMNPTLAAQFGSWAALAKSVADQIAAAPTTDAAAPLIQQIEDVIGEVLSVGLGMQGLPPPIPDILTALSIALPLIEAFIPTTPTSTAVAAMRSAPMSKTPAAQHFAAMKPTMTPGQALVILSR